MDELTIHDVWQAAQDALRAVANHPALDILMRTNHEAWAEFVAFTEGEAAAIPGAPVPTLEIFHDSWLEVR